MVAATPCLEDAFGYEEEARAGFKGLDGRFEGEMGEEAQRHGDVPEDAGAVVIAKDGGLAARVDVCEETERKIEAAEKGGGKARSARCIVDGLVDLVRQDGESVHHIDAIDTEELRCAETKDVLHGCCDGVGVGAVAGDVGENKDDVRPGRDCIEEVAACAGGEVPRMQIETLERRQSGGQRSAAGLRQGLHG